MLVHDQMPPGVPVLQKLKGEVTYRYAKTARGGTGSDHHEESRKPCTAVHEFLTVSDFTTTETGDDSG